jgi:hypothetical protein
VLSAEASADVRFFVVWVNRGIGDDRDSIDPSLLADERVTQYWDADGITGTSFAEDDLGGVGAEGFVYDVYYVFGPDASWGNVAQAGQPVVARIDQLLAQL